MLITTYKGSEMVLEFEAFVVVGERCGKCSLAQGAIQCVSIDLSIPGIIISGILAYINTEKPGGSYLCLHDNSSASYLSRC